MIGRLSQFKWTDKNDHSRDLIFIIVILGFGLMLVAKLAPYYKDEHKTVVVSSVKTVPTVPKGIVEQFTGLRTKGSSGNEKAKSGKGWSAVPRDHRAPSISERPLFDGQSVVLKARLLNPYSSTDESTPVEAMVFGTVPLGSDGDVDFSPAEGARLIGSARANISVKRLMVNFTEMVTRDGRSYAVQGQAIDSTTRSSGIEGDYSSGLPTRLAGIAIERLIMAADQVAMSHLFSATAPEGQAAQQFELAARQTNQDAAASVSREATKDLRDTKAEISLDPGFEFRVRLKGADRGVIAP